MTDKWYHGRTGDFEYEVIGHQIENGLRFEAERDPETGLIDPKSLPDAARMMPEGDVTGILIMVHPKGDEEASRFFWVHNPMGGTRRQWLNAIRVAAARYGIALEFDVDENLE